MTTDIAEKTRVDHEREYENSVKLEVANETPYAFLDAFEESPEKRVAQIQQCRMMMLANGYQFSKEEQQMLKDISSTDLGLLRLTLDESQNDSLKAFAGVIGEMLGRTRAPVRPEDNEGLDTAALPVVDLGDDSDIPDEALATDFPDISYDQVAKPTE